jgi:hypothetical protein
MSSKAPTSSVEGFASSDYVQFVRYLERAHLIPTSRNTTAEQKLRRIHDGIYALSLWDFNLKLPENAQAFLSEARSDAVCSMVLALRGFRKQAALSVREVLEDTLRHVYYSDHPVEFGWLTTHMKYYVGWMELKEYLCDSLLFSRDALKGDIVGALMPLYADLSKHVHAKSKEYMQLSPALKAIKFDESFYEHYAEQILKSVSCCNAILMLYRWDDYSAFDQESKNMIKKSINRGTYHLLMET